MDYKFLKLDKFEYVGYKYEDISYISKSSLQNWRGKKKVYYYLPNETHTEFTSTPKFNSKREEDAYLMEFNHALTSGYLPKSGAKKLRASSFDPKDGRFSIFFKHYYSDYSVKERTKDDRSCDVQKSVEKRIVPYFENIGINSITDITNQHIEEWDRSLYFTPKLRGEGFIKHATRNNWRKTLRAFLNTAKEQGYALQCTPETMNIYEYGKGGEIDTSGDARLVIYPQELIDAVEKCSFYVDTYKSPDIRKILRFWKETGLRPSEMFTLGDSNIIFKNGYPIELKIKELDNCPNGQKIGFKPKNKKSIRKVKLTNWSGDFLLALMRRYKGLKRYGKVGKNLIEYPFLFVFWDEKAKVFVRNDYEFKKLFKDITCHAIEEFKLNLRDDYILYDLRRRCNLYLKLELGYEVREAARFLGHSEFTNKKHYSLDEDQIQIEEKYSKDSLKRAIQRNPTVRDNYSRHADEEKFSKCSKNNYQNNKSNWLYNNQNLNFSSLNYLNFDSHKDR